MPIVSIITPAFNAEKYISKTIDSVLQQHFQDWEMIVIDDFSSDKTSQIVSEYVCRDSRIRYIKMDKNGGPVKARNKGIELAFGRFIAFLDSDDVWFPEKLAVQLKFMEDNRFSFTYSNYVANYNGVKILRKSPPRISYSKLLNKNYIGCLTAIYDTSHFGKVYMPDFGKRHDWALWLKLLKENEVAYGIETPLAEYTIRKNSLSSQKAGLVKDNWLVFQSYEGQGIISHIRFGYSLFINVCSTFREKGLVFFKNH